MAYLFRGLPALILWIFALCTFFLKTQDLQAVSASFTSQQGSKTFVRRNAAEVDESHEGYSLLLFGVRNELTPGMHTSNAAVIASAAKEFNVHRLQIGLGTHFFQQKTGSTPTTTPQILPAFGFEWRHPVFFMGIQFSERMVRAQVSFLADLFIPVEFSSGFENLPGEVNLWSFDAYAFLAKYGGVVLGYEPLQEVTRAGVWISPIENLQARALARIFSQSETYVEFSMRYSLDVFTPEERKIKNTTEDVPEKVNLTNKKNNFPKNKKVPSFAILVKWGLSPVEALKLSNEKNICALSSKAQEVLKRHKWECRV
ncbi:MAG: hypothetical protein LDLANPLL_00591 [Turneriella sp.]|nr:hypothetical protein [Turneriella sp.]